MDNINRFMMSVYCNMEKQHLHRYSQHGQDKWLWNNFFSNKDTGVFLEVGALDGLHCSNTLFFEEKGWTGLCIEPSPITFKRLKQNRNCICENVAVTDKIGTAKFRELWGWGEGLSGLVDKYDSKHWSRVDREKHHPDCLSDEIIEVNTTTLSNLLEKHKLYHIDFATIDTEGGEYEILKGLNLDQYIIDVLLVENNTTFGHERGDESPQVGNYLSDYYTKRCKIGDDDVYVRKTAQF